MDLVHETNADQAAYWNGAGGAHWTQRQETQDVVLAPISTLLLARAAPQAGERVIDVGCGCGATTVDFVHAVGAAGRVTAIDISGPMLARARERAPRGAPVDFVLGDATVLDLGDAHADLLASRFGVMFFADPVAAFTQLRRALRPGGRVAFACWRAPRLNPWMMLPLEAAYAHAPRLPQQEPDAPGPFAFADAARTRRLLEEAGFTDVASEPHDLALDIAAGGGLEAALAAALDIGPTSRALLEATPQVRALATEAIRTTLAPHARGLSVPLAAAIWLVTAANPA